jgi:hypothetical protein
MLGLRGTAGTLPGPPREKERGGPHPFLTHSTERVRESWRERRRKRKEGSRRGGCFPLAQIRERDSEERERAGFKRERERERESRCMEEEKRRKNGFLESSAQSTSIAPINDHLWSDRDEIL